MMWVLNNRLNETIILSTHIIWFGWMIAEISGYASWSGPLKLWILNVDLLQSFPITDHSLQIQRDICLYFCRFYICKIVLCRFGVYWKWLMGVYPCFNSCSVISQRGDRACILESSWVTSTRLGNVPYPLTFNPDRWEKVSIPGPTVSKCEE